MKYKVGDIIYYRNDYGMAYDREEDWGLVKRIEGDNIYCIWIKNIRDGDYEQTWVSENYNYEIRLVEGEEKEKYLDEFMVEML